MTDQDLFALVTRHFVTHAGKTAVVSRNRAVTYAELQAMEESIAARLRDVEGAHVGICLPRSPQMVAAMLAVLRGGGAYLPLDPAYPADRLAYMVEHSRMRRVVTTRALSGIFERTGIETLVLDDGSTASGPIAPPSVLPGSAPAYAIYTSGSTGKPKGVSIPRGAVANLLSSMLQRPGIAADDVLCAVTTLSFDIAVLELLGPLCAGATVVIATEEEAHDPRLLMTLLREQRGTVLQATPVTWQMLLAAGWLGDCALLAMCGGEPMTPGLARDLMPRVRSLWNMYGPTETTVWSTCQEIEDANGPISVGTPIADTTLYVLDEQLRPVERGVEGRLFIGGAGVALGYLHEPELTARRFLADPFIGHGTMYDTGDLARQDASGRLYVLGRSDFQVKLRGFRIELGEIEAVLSTAPSVEQAVCAVRRDDPANHELVAYYTVKPGHPASIDLRAHCAATLAPHMVPSRFVRLAALPRTLNGKVDRGALPAPAAASSTAEPSVPALPRSDVERVLVEIWCSVLSLPAAGVHDNFFDLGGTSLAAFSVVREIEKRLGVEVAVLRIFEHPTIAAMARHLEGSKADMSFVREARDRARKRRALSPPGAFDVAIVGMAGRFPGARDLEQLWTNLSEGRETVTVFGRDELDPLVPKRERDDPAYVPARGVLEDADLFDAAFFGISPSEAELMGPQLRVFLEVAWEAFENAGIVGGEVPGPVGVWAGMGNNHYYLFNVLTRPDKLAVMGEIAAEIANEKDHIAPRVSHKLDLKGPSLSVHAACATTLVVVENAYQVLVTHQVDVALAGGVDIRTPQRSGQRYEDGGVFSIDGHCRPFDAASTGTMFGEGAGAVVLKRLADALRDGDTIHAVIKGAAVNHDGGRKVGYLAPSVEGQARLVATALATADVHPDTITMVEAHGTGTPIGDPIEVEALTRVYRAYTQRRRYCAIGSIKSNFGHATTAAGIAGLLKVVLSMQHRTIPATLHYERPNPRIDFERGPFFVADRRLDWTPPPGVPRRAAVSSFGFCGTNAHVILEEAPEPAPSSRPARVAQLLLVSARSPEALEASARQLADALRGSSESERADRAYTTQVGRKRHEYRRCAVIRTSEDASTLTEPTGPSSESLHTDADAAPIAFVFPGQGAQYPGMGRLLYEQEPRFRETVDACAATLEPELGCDLRGLLFPAPDDVEGARKALNDTLYTQPAVFTLSYSLARLFQDWGARPSAMIGHSIGEFVAATLSGVMDRDDALRLVATRGRLMQQLPRGSMLTVRLPMVDVLERLPSDLDLAAANAPQLCVVAGPTGAIERFADQLAADGVTCRKLHTSHAFHSAMMEPAVEPFRQAVERARLSPPRIPYVSTVTGQWIKSSEATSPEYWARHLRSPVQFSRGVQVLLQDEQRVLLELGPRRTSTTLALQHRPKNAHRVLAAMPESDDQEETASALLALGSLWLHGARVDASALHPGETRRRVPLPTYPFQRKRFWIEPGNTVSFGIESSRAAAPVQPGSPVAVDAPATAPSSTDDVSASVVGLLEELLGHRLEDPDPDARFVALGIDSLLLTQLARAVRTRLAFDVTFRQLTERYSTTRLLTEAIRASRPAEAPIASPVTPTRREDPPPAPAPPSPPPSTTVIPSLPPNALDHPRSYGAVMAAAVRSIATRYRLRRCAVVGDGVRVQGRVWIWGGGRVMLGARVRLDASRAPIELHAEQGAEIAIGDDVVIEGGTSLEATRSITIGARSHLGMRCKIMDNHFHTLDDRNRRPEAKAVVVEEDVELGAGVILLPGAHVGKGAHVERRAVVGRAIDPGTRARGAFVAAELGGPDAE
jgi:amino acid adenylation domain-containing protein